MNYDEVEILLIEDNPNDVELTLRALRKNRISNKIYVISDGEEAIDYVFARNKYLDRNVTNLPRVILLDLKLPKIGGLEILRQIRADSRTCLIPVVVLTSSQEDVDVLESYKLGVNSYIVKPVEFENFIKAVSELGMYWLILNKSPNY